MKYSIRIEIYRDDRDYSPVTNTISFETSELPKSTLQTLIEAAVNVAVDQFAMKNVKRKPVVSSAEEEITPPPAPSDEKSDF